jgi:hypothetical protein
MRLMATSPAVEQPLRPPSVGKTWFQKRIDKMTRVNRQQERENIELQQRIAELETLMARWKSVALGYKEALDKRGLHGG